MTHPFLNHLHHVNAIEWDNFKTIDIGGVAGHVRSPILTLLKFSDTAVETTHRGGLPYVIHDGSANDLTNRIEKFRTSIRNSRYAHASGIKLNGEKEMLRISHKPETETPAYALVRRDISPLFGLPAASTKSRVMSHDSDGKPVIWLGRITCGKMKGAFDTAGGGWPFDVDAKENLWKEAFEEFGITHGDVDRHRKPVKRGEFHATLDRYHGYGVRLNHTLCYDLFVKPGFKPRSHDGDFDHFEAFTPEKVLKMMATTPGRFKPTAYLTLLQCFVHDGTIRARKPREKRPETAIGKLTVLEASDYTALVQGLQTEPPKAPHDPKPSRRHRVHEPLHHKNQLLSQLAA